MRAFLISLGALAMAVSVAARCLMTVRIQSPFKIRLRRDSNGYDGWTLCAGHISVNEKVTFVHVGVKYRLAAIQVTDLFQILGVGANPCVVRHAPLPGVGRASDWRGIGVLYSHLFARSEQPCQAAFLTTNSNGMPMKSIVILI